MPVNILQHHNGVIHHQANSQYQRQKRQGVDAKTGQRHQGKGTDQGYRNGDKRDERGSEGPQEHKDHQGDQHRGFDNRLKHAFDGAINEQGVVIGHIELDAWGQIALQLDHQLANTG